MEYAALKILFYDGECGMCNRSVDLLLKIDRNKRLRYAPLNGQVFKELFSTSLPTDADSIIYWKDANSFEKSDAVLELLKDVGGIWKIANVLRIIPRTMRDWSYDIVARNRYKWFGKVECRVLTKEERGVFFD